ncbi:MAG: hypothetical protein ACSLFD_11645 [Solirubrobacterales bacterium]
MSPTGEQKIPKGSYAAGRIVRLPEGAEAPIVVYINGVAQTAGVDYNLQGTKIFFTREIIKEELNAVRKSAMLLGLFGTYRKNETVDVQFQKDGKTELAGDLKIES